MDAIGGVISQLMEVITMLIAVYHAIGKFLAPELIRNMETQSSLVPANRWIAIYYPNSIVNHQRQPILTMIKPDNVLYYIVYDRDSIL